MGEEEGEEDYRDDDGRYDNDDDIGVLPSTLIIKSHPTISFPVCFRLEQ